MIMVNIPRVKLEISFDPTEIKIRTIKARLQKMYGIYKVLEIREPKE
jgi:hypothetical protein